MSVRPRADRGPAGQRPGGRAAGWRVARACILLACLVLACGASGAEGAAGASGGDTGVALPTISLGVGAARGPQEFSGALQVMLLLTVLAVAPSLLIMLTSFSRIVIVLGLLRQALGTPQMPPNQVLLGLSLFLTAFVMAPVVSEVHESAYTPYVSRQISQEEALRRGLRPLRQFMFRQTRDQDLALMVHLAKTPRPRERDDVATYVLIPAFIISELKSGFQMGFVLFLPFIVIDFVVSSVLLSMGMLFLPPTMIALPFKLLLFVLADGWHLVVRSLVTSFH
ncbi:MAG TPA: flagellar type III secretion system pore protein FliP [Candidatus Methylomirabilis sp.]|nr:flagellar type III secretion system pore protein FliP [Candidatus Methylomirabilis sp.]